MKDISGGEGLIAPSLFEKKWDMSQAYLDYMISCFRQREVPVMIVSMATIDLAPGLHEAYREDALRMDERVSMWAQERELPFLSLVPLIDGAADNRRDFYSEVLIEDDGHPTPHTHARLESTLRPWLLKHLNGK